MILPMYTVGTGAVSPLDVQQSRHELKKKSLPIACSDLHLYPFSGVAPLSPNLNSSGQKLMQKKTREAKVCTSSVFYTLTIPASTTGPHSALQTHSPCPPGTSLEGTRSRLQRDKDSNTHLVSCRSVSRARQCPAAPLRLPPARRRVCASSCRFVVA